MLFKAAHVVGGLFWYSLLEEAIWHVPRTNLGQDPGVVKTRISLFVNKRCFLPKGRFVVAVFDTKLHCSSLVSRVSTFKKPSSWCFQNFSKPSLHVCVSVQAARHVRIGLVLRAHYTHVCEYVSSFCVLLPLRQKHEFKDVYTY